MNLKPCHDNCTISKTSECKKCTLNEKLICKFDKKVLHSFMAIGLPPAVLTIFGMIIIGLMSGAWWILITYVIFTFGMIGIVEMFFLCRHCPYYAAEGNTIVCNGNYGSLKLLPYDPKPMNKVERFLMSAFVTIDFFIMPLAGLGYGIFQIAMQYSTYGLIGLLGFTGITIGTVMASSTFVIILSKYFCTKCVNFSCPLNSVPKETVDEYLRKNHVMRKAWEGTGYKLDNVSGQKESAYDEEKRLLSQAG